jgi:glycine oxidase
MPAILEDYGIVVLPVREDLTIVSSFFEFKGFTLEWSEERLKWLKGVLLEHVPTLRDARLEGYQTGFRPCTPDMLPVVGELPGFKNIYIAIGPCRLGVILASVTAELVLSICNSTIEWKDFSAMGCGLCTFL